ncbi:MAG TPA: alpha/beta hydrolase [Polyangiaceae bacterium]|nr:alpha/beta hydrolase [Polyangiaceae bacterium]
MSYSSLADRTTTDLTVKTKVLPALRTAARTWTRELTRVVFEQSSSMLGYMGSIQPGANPELYDVEVVRNIPYVEGAGEENFLDVYRPVTHSGPWPVVLYIHGGSFRIMSKDSHWMMAMAYARRGYLVVNVNYRLAPRHRYPAALQDVSKAWLWVLRNAHRFGGDPSRIVVAGESAGGNLAAALAIETTFARPEPWAREVFEAGRVPDAVVAGCGILQVSDPERFGRDSSLPAIVLDRILEVRDGYYPKESVGPDGRPSLADPLLVLESDERSARALPPFFVPVGGADPIVSDSIRLGEALERRGSRVEVRVYAGEPHAFTALTWRRQAKAAWKDTHEFLSSRLPAWIDPLRSRPAERMKRSIPVRDWIVDRLAA